MVTLTAGDCASFAGGGRWGVRTQLVGTSTQFPRLTRTQFFSRLHCRTAVVFSEDIPNKYLGASLPTLCKTIHPQGLGYVAARNCSERLWRTQRDGNAVHGTRPNGAYFRSKPAHRTFFCILWRLQVEGRASVRACIARFWVRSNNCNSLRSKFTVTRSGMSLDAYGTRLPPDGPFRVFWWGGELPRRCSAGA